jgi:hypothetical protein
MWLPGCLNNFISFHFSLKWTCHFSSVQVKCIVSASHDSRCHERGQYSGKPSPWLATYLSNAPKLETKTKEVSVIVRSWSTNITAINVWIFYFFIFFSPLTYGPFPRGVFVRPSKGTSFSQLHIKCQGHYKPLEKHKIPHESLPYMVTPSRMWANIGASSHLTAPKRHPMYKRTFKGKWYPFRFHMMGVVSLCHQSLGQWHYWDGQNVAYIRVNRESTKGHFTHKTESSWPWHFKHSHWWKRRSWCKFSSHTMLEWPTEYVNATWM